MLLFVRYHVEVNQNDAQHSQATKTPGAPGFPRWELPNKSVPGFPGERREPPERLLKIRVGADMQPPQEGNTEGGLYLLPPLPPSPPPPNAARRLEDAVSRMHSARRRK